VLVEFYHTSRFQRVISRRFHRDSDRVYEEEIRVGVWSSIAKGFNWCWLWGFEIEGFGWDREVRLRERQRERERERERERGWECVSGWDVRESASFRKNFKTNSGCWVVKIFTAFGSRGFMDRDFELFLWTDFFSKKIKWKGLSFGDLENRKRGRGL